MEKLKKEQLDVINHEKGNILVSASAGSGKTFVMIKRLVRLIVEGKARVKEILAVTFTEAAAKDMKRKLTESITEAINNGAENLAEELADVGYSDVCTIDSFCARIVRVYFYKAGVSPDFSVADDAVSDALKTEAMQKTLKEFYEAKDERFTKLSLRYSVKRKDDELINVALKIYDYLSTEPDPERLMEKSLYFYGEEGAKELNAAYILRRKKQITDLIKRLEDAGQKAAAGKYLKGAETAENYIAAAKSALLKDSPYSLSEIILPEKKFERNPDEEGKKIKDAIYLAAKEFAEILSETKEIYSDPVTDLKRAETLKEYTGVLFDFVNKFAKNYAELKREENVLDFNDIERFALLSLKDPEVSREVKAKYKYVFIDEYQDVNGVQEEIISLVSDNNVFMVGDVKQSIYGFRGCRPDFFESKYKLMEKNGEKTVRLNYNFRSAEAVINAVNDVFSFSMTEERGGVNYKEGSALISGGQFEGYKGRVAAFSYLPEEKEKKAPPTKLYDVLSAAEEAEEEISGEALLIAKIINGELGKNYYDVKSGEQKTVEYKDIAVLSRDRSGAHAKSVVTGLKKLGVPVLSQTPDCVLYYPEIIVLINLLKLIDNAKDGVALATVMKSPVGGFSEEELAFIALSYYNSLSAEQKKDYDFTDAVKNLSEENFSLKKKVAEFTEYIALLREKADFSSAAEILNEVINGKNYYAFLYASAGGEEKAERVKFFVKKAAEKNYTPRAFLALAGGNGRPFEISSSGGENAVKFMTIHASKGLEFPVVIVCGLDKTFNFGDNTEKVLKDREYGFAARYYDDQERVYRRTPHTYLISEKIKENLVAEELRLFYVATTRAQYSLSLAFTYKDTAKKENIYKRYTDFLPPDFCVKEYSAKDLTLLREQSRTRKVLFSGIDNALALKLAGNFAFLYPFEEETRMPLKSSVSAALDASSVYYDKFFYGEEDITDAKKGTLAHRFLELYDFSAMPDINSYTQSLIARGLMKKEELDSINVDKIGRSLKEVVALLAAGRKVYKEKSFVASIEANKVLDVKTESPVVLQGVIDLLIINGDTAVIVDYKYTSHSGEGLKKRYGKQLNLYAYAVEKALKKKVTEKYVLSLLTGETVKID